MAETFRPEDFLYQAYVPDPDFYQNIHTPRIDRVTITDQALNEGRRGAEVALMLPGGRLITVRMQRDPASMTYTLEFEGLSDTTNPTPQRIDDVDRLIVDFLKEDE